MTGGAGLQGHAVGNLLAARRHPELRAMTTPGLEAVMGEAVPDLVEYVIMRAKAEALTVFGETNQAADLMGRYV